MSYYIEGQRDEMAGEVIVGSKIGYEGGKSFRVEDIVEFIHEINQERNKKSQRTMECMISEATLVGRATESGYQEEVYLVRFSISPRSQKIERNEFFNYLIEYGKSIGEKAQQERIYLQFDNKITILRRT